MDQWFASKSPIKLGGLSPGNSTSDVARIIAAALNLPMQLVEGYKGTNEIRLAADAGELHGACWAWETLKVAWSKAIPAGDVNVVLQVTPKKIPELPNVPMSLDLAKTDEARQLAQSRRHRSGGHRARLCHDTAYAEGSAANFAHCLRQNLNRPEFIAEAKRATLDINPLTGEEVRKIVDDLYKLSPALRTKLASILSPK